VLLGYSLGKSQELLRGLADAGLPIVLHESVFTLTQFTNDSANSFPVTKNSEANPPPAAC